MIGWHHYLELSSFKSLELRWQVWRPNTLNVSFVMSQRTKTIYYILFSHFAWTNVWKGVPIYWTIASYMLNFRVEIWLQDAKYHRYCLNNLYRKASNIQLEGHFTNEERKLHGIAFGRAISFIEEALLNTTDTIPVFKLLDLIKHN